MCGVIVCQKETGWRSLRNIDIKYRVCFGSDHSEPTFIIYYCMMSHLKTY